VLAARGVLQLEVPQRVVKLALVDRTQSLDCKVL
jgi:hypothetical protein